MGSCARLAVLAAPAALLLAACSSSGGTRATASATPRASASAQGTGCVSQSQAKTIWTGIDERISAIELDPKHAGVTDIATGQALQLINAYLQMQLISANVTEREVDQLVDLAVVDGGCNNGTLQVRVTEKVVQDDYLKPNGQVDHADPAAGSTLHLLESFVRSGSTWKEIDFQNLDQPATTPTPQLF